MRRDLPLEIFSVLFDKPSGDFFDGNTCAVAHALQLPDDFQHLRLDVHAPVGHEFLVIFACHLTQCLARARVLDHAQKRHEDLRQARLDRAVYQRRIDLAFAKIPKAKHEQPVAKLQSLALVVAREVDGNVFAQFPPARLFRQAAAFERPVLEVAPRGNQLRPEHRIGPRAEFAPGDGLAAQHGKAAPVAVVQDFDEFGPFVREAEVAFVHDQGAAHGIENAEQGRDRRSAAGEDGLVAERTDREEKARLPRAGVVVRPADNSPPPVRIYCETRKEKGLPSRLSPTLLNCFEPLLAIL